MKERPPNVEHHVMVERDVLMEAEPRRTPRVRSSIIGDKKLTARDLADTKPRSEESSPRSELRATAKEKPTASASVRAPRVQAPTRTAVEDPILSAAPTNRRGERGYASASARNERIAARAVSKKSAVDEVRAQVSRKIIYRGLGLAMVLSSFAAIAYFATEPLTRLLERPLKSVAVEGEFQYLPKDRAMSLIEKEIDGDFLQLNMEHLKNILESDPWVEHVYLSRRWPDTLVVKIAEQKPIARWDANGFLNQRGEIIRVQEADKLLGLPWLQGNENNAREIMMQYQDLSTLLRSRGLEIIALKCDDKKSWRLTLKNDKEIAIGREQVMEKLRRFVNVYDKFLSSVWNDVRAVDVRYSNGVAVRWVPDSEMAKKYLKPEVATIKNTTVKNNTTKK